MRRAFSRIWVLLAVLAACAVAPGSGDDAVPARAVRLLVVQHEMRGDRTLGALCRDVDAAAARAADAGADLVVFPELVAFDCWVVVDGETERDAALRLAGEVTPGLVDAAVRAAAAHDVAVLVGGPRRVGGRVRNTAFLAFVDGTIVRQDKLFLTAWERSVGWEAGDELVVFAAPWGRTAIAVCYDVEVPAVSQLLARQTLDVLLVPSMTESAQGRRRVLTTAAARAVEHHAFVVVAATVGEPGPDWRHFGESTVFAPHDGVFDGVLARARADEPGDIVVLLDVPALRANRRQSKFDPAADQRARRRGPTLRMLRWQ